MNMWMQGLAAYHFHIFIWFLIPYENYFLFVSHNKINNVIERYNSGFNNLFGSLNSGLFVFYEHVREETTKWECKNEDVWKGTDTTHQIGNEVKWPYIPSDFHEWSPPKGVVSGWKRRLNKVMIVVWDRFHSNIYLVDKWNSFIFCITLSRQCCNAVWCLGVYVEFWEAPVFFHMKWYRCFFTVV
jgi:hypothetical protein